MNDERRMNDDRHLREERQQHQQMHDDRRMHEIRHEEQQQQQQQRIMHERRLQEEREHIRNPDGLRREQAYLAAQEDERIRHEQRFGSSRGVPPQQMHPTHFPAAGGFDHGQPRSIGMGGLREQSMREAHEVMAQAEQDRLQRESNFREQEAHARRRHEEAALYPARRTPLGMGGFGGPPPGAPPGPGRR